MIIVLVLCAKEKIKKLRGSFRWKYENLRNLLRRNCELLETLSDIQSDSSFFSKLRGNIYLVGIGHDINYNNLLSIKESNDNAKLYLAPYDENIYSATVTDVGDVILEREQFRKRNGTITAKIGE